MKQISITLCIRYCSISINSISAEYKNVIIYFHIEFVIVFLTVTLFVMRIIRFTYRMIAENVINIAILFVPFMCSSVDDDKGMSIILLI